METEAHRQHTHSMMIIITQNTKYNANNKIDRKAEGETVARAVISIVNMNMIHSVQNETAAYTCCRSVGHSF